MRPSGRGFDIADLDQSSSKMYVLIIIHEI